MRVLLTGAAGQLGQALVKTLPQHQAGRPLELFAFTRSHLDLADPVACRKVVDDLRPDWVINAGSFTSVDAAESQQEIAMLVNAAAPAAFAQGLAAYGGRLLQLSTDFVFNGSHGHPYEPSHPVDPLSVYGATKAYGEEAATKALTLDKLCILRTSWLYGPVGRNFLLTMLNLHRTNDLIGVVADQISCPTSTSGLALACWKILDVGVSGIHHWSDTGVASWYDFAIAIGEIAKSTGILDRAASVQPLTTSEYPTAARRPSFSLLDCSMTRQTLDLPTRYWRQSLLDVLRQMA